MKKMTILAMFVAIVLSASAQFYMHVWYNDSVFSLPVLNVDSITFTDMWLEPGEPVDPEPETPSEGIGVFSVSADKKVTFSPGNLQYTQSTNTWSFASTQYEIIGIDNVTGGSVESDPTYGFSKDGDALADKVDLFGWSTSATNFGVSTSKDYSDYNGSFVDWGTNPIGDDAPDTWRTLTYEEWDYLLNQRPNADQLVAAGMIWDVKDAGVNGLVILPDNWTCPEGVTFKSGFYSSHGAEYYAAYQTFTADQWSKMESAGAIFLPAAGFRNGTLVDFVEGYGRYWSATEYSSYNAYCLDFSSNEAYMYKDYRDFGHSVRLVKDVEDEPVEPEVPEGVITCAEAVAICEATGTTSTTESYTIQGYVTEIKTVWSEQYGNITFWMADTKDGGQVLQCYRVKPVKPEEKNVKVGDYVEVNGTLVNYYGTTPEVNAGGTYTILVAAEGGETPDTPVEPEEPETPAGEPLADGYAKVTNMATLADGDKVVLYCDAYAVGVTGFDGNKSATMGEAAWVEYVVETVEGGIMLKDEDQYISLIAKNSFRYNAEGSVLNVTENAMLSAYLEADGKTYFLYRNANTQQGNALCRMYVDRSGNDEYAPFYVYEVTEKTGEGEDPVEPNPGTPDTPEEPETPSEGIGVFSVSADKKVTFSPGNLQYHPANNEWRFAPSQLDYIGEENENIYISSTYNGWLDLFGWGTGNNPNNSSRDYNDYQTFVDWGTNQIGADAPNTWRTLTNDEWEYLLNTRPNASSLKGVAQVNGVNGLIFLPDNWTCPSGVTFKSGFHSEYSVEAYGQYQTFSAAQWSKLESAGAVFLPSSGNRVVSTVQNFGRYWSATEYTSYNARSLYLDSFEAGLNFYNRCDGHSVRLVKDVEGEDIDPEQPGEPVDPEPETPSEGIGVFSVSADKKVTFSPGNLQYYPATDEWQFAENQTDYIGADNSNISDTYEGWLDLFGWSTSATNFGVSTSTDYNDYSGSFVDWGKNKIGDDDPNTWRTLTYDEWNYLRNGRPNASSLRGVAQVNGVNGLIFLPDNWTCPEGVTFKSGFHSSYGVDYYAAYQTFTAEQWAKLEAAGAIFLPAAGGRDATSVYLVQNYGFYWSVTEYNSNYAYYLYFSSGGAYMNYDIRNYGHSVRLVKDL